MWNRLKAKDAKAIDQLQGDGIQILARVGNGIIDHSMKGMVVQGLHGIRRQMLRNGLDDEVRCITTSSQTINGIKIDGPWPALQLSGNKIIGAAKNGANILIGQLPGIGRFRSGRILLHFFHLWSSLPESSRIIMD